MTDDPPWYVAQTLAGQETTAALNLRRQQHWVFLPMRPFDRPGGARLWRPRFPGYVLVKLDLDRPGSRWRSINSTPAVRHLLPVYLERPLPLPDELVEHLMKSDDDHVLIEHYAENEVVRLLCGPLAGILAEVERQDGAQLRARLPNGAGLNTRTTDVERA